MKANPDRKKVLFSYMRKKKIVTYKEVKELVGYEINSFIRIMKDHGYYSSCNKNGKYYTLGETPSFDENGLWEFKQVKFSKYGTLKNTIQHMVDNSEDGVCASDAVALHGSSGRIVICQLYRDKLVNRKMIDGTFVYTAKDDKHSSRQLQTRLDALNQSNVNMQLPSEEIVIGILVLFLKKPKWSVKQIVNKMKKEGVLIERNDVTAVINYYKLPLKKTI